MKEQEMKMIEKTQDSYRKKLESLNNKELLNVDHSKLSTEQKVTLRDVMQNRVEKLENDING